MANAVPNLSGPAKSAQPAASQPPAASQQPAAAVPVPESWEDPAGFLKHYGWRPMGDPRHPLTKWWDPTKPKVAHETREPVYRSSPKPGGKPGEMVRVQQTHNDENGLPQPTTQVIYHPAGSPVEQAFAIMVQEQRLAQELADREKEQT